MRSIAASAPPREAATARPRRLIPALAGCNTAGNGWAPTRLISDRGDFLLRRARVNSELGPGCYVWKTPRPAAPHYMAALAKLRREADVAASVHDSGVISVLVNGLDDERPHLVLPYLDGISLRRLIDGPARGNTAPPRIRLPVTTALALVRQISAALGALHAAGWLHGQVRPEHIIVSPQGHATLIDLTQCRQLDGSETSPAGIPPGGEPYAAPDHQARARLTPACDIYALGITLFEAIAGRPPFAGSSPQGVARAHQTCRVPELGCFRHAAPPDIDHLLRQMLAKEPLRRPTAEQVVRTLAELEIMELACRI